VAGIAMRHGINAVVRRWIAASSITDCTAILFYMTITLGLQTSSMIAVHRMARRGPTASVGTTTVNSAWSPEVEWLQFIRPRFLNKTAKLDQSCLLKRWAINRRE